MPRRLIILLAFLMSAAMPAVAQTPAPDAAPGTDGAPTLPQAISSLLTITYACQNVSGIALYNQADDMSRQLTLHLTRDANITGQFMKRAEDQARTACPNTTSCWRDLMDKDTPLTMENAKTTCERLSQRAAETVASAYKALTAPN